jgi:hypothetical protein
MNLYFFDLAPHFRFEVHLGSGASCLSCVPLSLLLPYIAVFLNSTDDLRSAISHLMSSSVPLQPTIPSSSADWVRVPNQSCISGFSWTTPSEVSGAGFSTVVPAQSGFPLDVGWATWGAGLTTVYSHDGPFGIYGKRIFVPIVETDLLIRPIVVQNFDTSEQILVTSLLSAAGRWTPVLSKEAKLACGNWWLLRMFGSQCRTFGFGYNRKTNLALETLRAVAAVSFGFHRMFGAIRCSACKTTRTLGDFDGSLSSNVRRCCFICSDPSSPLIPVTRSDSGDEAYADNHIVDCDPDQTEVRTPTLLCNSHPVCGRCRYAEESDLDAAYARRDRFGIRHVSDSDEWSNSS